MEENIIENKDEKAVVKEQSKYFSGIGLRYFIITVVIIFVQLVFIGVAYILFGQDFVENNSLLISLIPIDLIGLPVAFLLMHSVPKTNIEKNKQFTFIKLLPYFFVAIAVMFIGNLIGTGINFIIELFFGASSNNAVKNVIMDNSIWQNAVFVGIIGPIVEELLFRKLLIDRLYKFGEATAVLVSSMMFGIYHGNITQFVYATMVGLILAYVYVKSGKIIYTMLIHIVINMLGSVVSILVLKYSGYLDIVEQLGNIEDMDANSQEVMDIMINNAGGLAIYGIYFMIYIACVIAGVVIAVIALACKKISFAKGQEQLIKGKRFQTVVLNVGAVLFIIVWALMFAYSFLQTIIPGLS